MRRGWHIEVMAMLVAETVNNYITSKWPHPVCDSCIVKNIGLTKHAHAAQITGALGTTSDFVRERGDCVLCKCSRLVIKSSRSQ